MNTVCPPPPPPSPNSQMVEHGILSQQRRYCSVNRPAISHVQRRSECPQLQRGGADMTQTPAHLQNLYRHLMHITITLVVLCGIMIISLGFIAYFFQSFLSLYEQYNQLRLEREYDDNYEEDYSK